jgi:hypothetical protein
LVSLTQDILAIIKREINSCVSGKLYKAKKVKSYIYFSSMQKGPSKQTKKEGVAMKRNHIWQ